MLTGCSAERRCHAVLQVMGDLLQDGQQVTVAKGGRGGKGNASMRHNKPNRFVSRSRHCCCRQPCQYAGRPALACAPGLSVLHTVTATAELTWVGLQAHIASLSLAAEAQALTQRCDGVELRPKKKKRVWAKASAELPLQACCRRSRARLSGRAPSARAGD